MNDPVRAVAVHPRVILAFTAIAALVAAALPGGANADSLRFWWDADPATALASVSCLLALPLLVIASWAADGRGAGLLGAALVMLAAILLGIADRSRCGSLLVAAGAIAVTGAVAIIASPHRAAAAADRGARWNLGGGAALLVIGAIQLARHGATGPTVLPPTPPIPTVTAMLLGAALVVTGMLGRGARAEAGERTRRAAIGAIAVAILLALLVPILALVDGDRVTALAGARASMLAVAASMSLGALLSPDLRRVSHKDFLAPHSARPASETPHGHR